MSYLSRTAGRRYRHDPARFGIFIHGGANYRPKWDGPESTERRLYANRFTLSPPSSTPSVEDTDPRMLALRAVVNALTPQPTFSRAVALALNLRRAHPELARCGIYACTDFVYSRREGAERKGQPTSCGRLAVQLIAPPEMSGRVI